MRTPLAKVKGLGSAKEGAHHWLMQRLTAVALLFLSTWLIYSLLQFKGQSFQQIHEFVANPLHAAGIFLFIAVVSYHAMLGLQVVIEDYIHNTFFRYVGLIKVKFFGYLLPALSLFFLIKIMN